MNYETGLQRLLERLGKNHSRYAEVLTFQARLLENIQQENLFGSSETIRSERARIISILNRVALSTLGVSFNDLCMSWSQSSVEASRLADLASNIRESYALIREYEDIIRFTSDPKEKARARKSVAEQWDLIQEYLSEYRNLVYQLGAEIPIDIKQIGTHFRNVETKSDLLIVRKALRAFSESELRLLCFDLGIDLDVLFGDTTEKKIASLLDHLERRSRLEELIAYLRREHPGLL